MGLSSDFVVADRSEATAVADTVDRERWPSLQSSGFTILEVGLLHFVLTGADPDAPVSPPRFVTSPFSGKEAQVTVGTAYLDGFTCHDDRGEAWVHEVPPSLVEELAKASGLDAVAAKWAQLEELEGADPEDVKGVLVELQGLARLAREQKKSLLLCTSL